MNWWDISTIVVVYLILGLGVCKLLLAACDAGETEIIKKFVLHLSGL